MAKPAPFDQEEGLKHLIFIGFDKVARPVEGMNYCYLERWWIVHPDKGVAFYKRANSMSPQCSSSEGIAQHLRDSLWPSLELRFMPLVSRRMHLDEFSS